MQYYHISSLPQGTITLSPENQCNIIKYITVRERATLKNQPCRSIDNNTQYIFDISPHPQGTELVWAPPAYVPDLPPSHGLTVIIVYKLNNTKRLRVQIVISNCGRRIRWFTRSKSDGTLTMYEKVIDRNNCDPNSTMLSLQITPSREIYLHTRYTNRSTNDYERFSDKIY